MIDNKVKKAILKPIYKLAIKTSIDSANSCCFFICCQPDLPNSVKKLNKRKDLNEKLR